MDGLRKCLQIKASQQSVSDVEMSCILHDTTWVSCGFSRRRKNTIKYKMSIYCNVNIFLPTDFVDKRGSRVEKTSTEDLHRFYEMSDEADKGKFPVSTKVSSTK